MPNLPLDPDVADTAPSDSVLTVYDEEHIITICACSTRTQRVRTGAKLPEQCCILIRNMSPIEPAGRSKAIVARQMNERSRLSATAARWARPLKGFPECRLRRCSCRHPWRRDQKGQSSSQRPGRVRTRCFSFAL
jgi:hypothetical protein